MRSPSDHDLDLAASYATRRLSAWLIEKENLEAAVASDGKSTSEEGGGLKDWRRGALCLTINGDWTEVPNGPGQETVKRRELAICEECPVRAPCLEAGINEPGGVWGGMLPKDRRRIKRERSHGVDRRCGTMAGFSAHRRREEGPCDPCRLAYNTYTRKRKRRRTP